MLNLFFLKEQRPSVRKLTTFPVTPSQPSKGRVDDFFAPKTSWRNPVAAAALSLVLGFASQDAAALALGRVNVLSALGEPLRAEIEVPEITAEEAASLRTAVGSPEAFRAAGLEYNPVLSGAQISLQRRANGSAFLRLSSDRTINEPFVDLILEASWSSGRIVRDYTMLFDPSNLRAQAPAPSVSAPAATSALSSPSVAPRAPSASSASAQAASPAPAPAPREPKMAAKPMQKEKASPVKAAPTAPKDSIKVKSGDTAAALAARYKPSGVSLDQMLVAMLNTNADAFIGGNVNRLKSGALLDMQAASAAAPGTGTSDAKQTIVAQSKDFNEFRRRLAGGAQTVVSAAPSRAAGGKVDASVSEPKAAATAPDKLTLSKGSVATKAKEEAVAKASQAKADAARVAELSKNISDLNKLGTATVAKPTAGPASAAAVASSAPGVKVAGSAPVVPTAPALATATLPKVTTQSTTVTSATVASTPATTATTSTSAAITTPTAATALTTSAAVTTPTITTTQTATPAATPTAAAKPAVITLPAPAPEPSFMESLMDNPATLPGAGLLLAGLGGLAFWRNRQRKKSASVDSSFLESRLQPDSFFGASGGQRVDTADSGNGAGAGSSMVYSPSQLDAAGDVDPVAEADVYLAYGRDLQAEEILKEALRTSPSRVAIHLKLMEIYAKRRDAKAFESVAKEAFNLTKGEGPEWTAASALGREMDASNPLYRQGNAPASTGLAGTVTMGSATTVTAAAAMTTAAATDFNSTKTMPTKAQAGADSDFDIDLDLDFGSGVNELVSAPSVADLNNATPSGLTEAMVDFDMSEPAALGAIKLSEPDFASFSSDLNFSSAPQVPAVPTAPMSLKTAPSGTGSLEFDLGNLSLDLPNLSAVANTADASVSGDPLETKLALALEFRDIGDADGARSLVQEVADEATGALKTRALKMLADLG